MNQKDVFVSPKTGNPVFRRGSGSNEVFENDHEVFGTINGLPNFIFPETLQGDSLKVKNFYDNRAEDYDRYLHLTFFTYEEDEVICRRAFLDKLDLNPRSKVLEIACGTGRDSTLLAEMVGDSGELHVQDFSERMLEKCVRKLESKSITGSVCLANARHLPYPDNYFDGVYSFGGLGEFPDIKGCLGEMIRVSKPGSRVVVGDESIPPWLRNTEFFKILNHTNSQFSAPLPLEEMPVEARDVEIKWVIGGTFYLISFEVGEGEPSANFEFPIPGIRGGTYRTRYEGQLEGVDPEAKELAWGAVKRKKTNMHDWLTKIVKKAARDDLAND